MAEFTHFDDMAAHLASAQAIGDVLDSIVWRVGEDICPLCLAAEMEQFARWLRTGEFDDSTDMHKALEDDVMKMLRGKNGN